MKYLSLSAVIFAMAGLAVGCSPGNLQVSNPNAPAGNQGSGHSGAPSLVGNPTPTPGSTPVPGDSSDKISFESVQTTGSTIDQLNAFAFGAIGSTTTSPVSVALSVPTFFAPAPLLAADDHQLVYLRSDGLMASSLVATTLGSLSTTALYEFPQAATLVSISLSTQLVAWIDQAGEVFVSSWATGVATAIKLPGASDYPVALALSQSGTRLLVKTSAGDLVTYLAGANGWAQESKLASVTAAALSADGAHLAQVSAKGVLTVDGAMVGTLASAAVHDLSWDGNGSLIYWAHLKSGANEIRSLDLTVTPSQETTETTIGLPANAADGVACPVRVDGTLFFAEFSGGVYQVEKLVPVAGAAPQVVSVAVPPSSDGGFICPVSAQAKAGAP